MKAGFYTLGCKLNQCETEALADAFRSAGLEPVGIEDDADLYIVNTCTVTSKSEQKARRILRKILAEHPGRPLIVTGCYAQVEQDAIRNLGSRVFPVGLEDKAGLLGLPEFLAAGTSNPAERISDRIAAWIDEEAPLPRADGRFRFQAARFSFHTRAFLKIQDGCDNHCTYCRVRIARGPSLSLGAEDVLRRFRRLEEEGYCEIVLTGVNLCSYRWEGGGLDSLLGKILSAGGSSRIRLSSLEPDGITESLARVLSNPRICPHFHLPVQSGSDTVLRNMRRRYTSDTVLEAVGRLRSVKENPFIAADLIVGFPGETGADHRSTVDLVRKIEPADLHVFPFSPRPGTEAVNMAGKIPERTARERASELRSFAEESLAGYALASVGTRRDIVVEEESRGEWEGMADNYLTVRGSSFPGTSFPTPEPGTRIIAKIVKIRDKKLIGIID